MEGRTLGIGNRLGRTGWFGLVLWWLALGVGLPACGADTDDAGPTGRKSVTVLLYMNADNDLESSAIADLKELVQLKTHGKFQVLVQIDRAERYSTSSVGGLGNFTTAKRLRVADGKLVEQADLGELNSSAPETLAEFVAWGAKAAPADRYFLVLWDHGGGWTGFGLDNTAPGTAQTMTLPQIRTALQTGMLAGGVKQFDLLGFDACLMGNLDAALLAREFAQFFVGSEELVPGHGWNYTALAALSQDTNLPAKEVGLRILDGFAAQTKSAKTAVKSTLALTDLSKLGPLEEAIDALGARLKSGDPTANRTRLEVAKRESIELGKTPQDDKSPQLADLVSLTEALALTDSTLMQEVKAIEQAARAAVIAFVSGDKYRRCVGLSVYAPSPKRFEATRTAYLDAANAGGWATLLRDTHDSAQPATPDAMPKFADPEGNAILSQDDAGGVLVSGPLAPGTFAGVTEVEVVYSVLREAAQTEVVFLGDVVGALDTSGVASAHWDGKILYVSADGGEEQPVYASVEEFDGLRYVTVPALYRLAGDDVPVDADLAIVLDANGEIVADYLYLEQAGVWSEVEPEPGATLSPIVLVAPVPEEDVDLPEPTWEERSAPFAADADLQFRFAFADEDPEVTALLLELFASDAEENFDVVFGAVDL